MGRRKDLTPEEKASIVRYLGQGTSTIDMSKLLKRDLDHRTIKNFVRDSQKGRKKRAQAQFNKINERHLRQVRRHLVQSPLATSKEVFEKCGLPEASRPTRCKVLKEVARTMKATVRPPLNKKHMEQRLKWANTYMKRDFSTVIFTDECRATLDGPDGWAKGWVAQGRVASVRLKRQQSGGGVMFWAAIVNDNLIGPFRVADGVKIDSKGYCSFLDENFLGWWRKQSLKRRKALMFMHDNAPAHASRFTRDWLHQHGIKEDQIMAWPAYSPDLNPIENLWSILKQKIYANGKQYSSKDSLWDAIVTAAKSVDKKVIGNLTKSVGVVEKKGTYMNN